MKNLAKISRKLTVENNVWNCLTSISVFPIENIVCSYPYSHQVLYTILLPLSYSILLSHFLTNSLFLTLSNTQKLFLSNFLSFTPPLSFLSFSLSLSLSLSLTYTPSHLITFLSISLYLYISLPLLLYVSPTSFFFRIHSLSLFHSHSISFSPILTVASRIRSKSVSHSIIPPLTDYRGCRSKKVIIKIRFPSSSTPAGLLSPVPLSSLFLIKYSFPKIWHLSSHHHHRLHPSNWRLNLLGSINQNNPQQVLYKVQ